MPSGTADDLSKEVGELETGDYTIQMSQPAPDGMDSQPTLRKHVGDLLDIPSDLS